MAKEDKFDVAVVGAGPAGMMAAGIAAESGAKVILIEKNKQLGRKLLLTGKGRCNITNAEFNLRELVKNYGKNGNFLFHAFSVFGPKDVISFFEKLGLKTKIERGKRVFPASDRSQDVLRALVNYLIKNKVDIIYDSGVVKVSCQNRKIKKLILKEGEVIAKNYIFCTGGKSYPLTGSTGDGFKWASNLGHCIKDLSPALVPIKIKEKWIKELQGLSLKNVEISVFQKGKKAPKTKVVIRLNKAFPIHQDYVLDSHPQLQTKTTEISSQNSYLLKLLYTRSLCCEISVLTHKEESKLIFRYSLSGLYFVAKARLKRHSTSQIFLRLTLSNFH